MRFLFLYNNLAFGANESFDLGEDHLLRRATPDEIARIKEYGDRLGFLMEFNYQQYQNTITRTSDSVSSVPMSEKDWRYSVVAFRTEKASPNIRTALALLENSIYDLFMLNLAGESVHFYSSPAVLFTTLTSAISNGEPKPFSQDDASQVRQIVRQLLDFPEDSDFAFIAKAFNDFSGLRAISHISPFKIIAIYSVIELLLTHRPTTQTDSINRQITYKMILTNNRFEQPIDIRRHFDSTDIKLESLLNKLYTYRSEIAHGTFSGFQQSLQILKNASLVYNFLDSFLKRLLILCLSEPRLVHDLRKC